MDESCLILRMADAETAGFAVLNLSIVFFRNNREPAFSPHINIFHEAVVADTPLHHCRDWSVPICTQRPLTNGVDKSLIRNNQSFSVGYTCVIGLPFRSFGIRILNLPSYTLNDDQGAFMLSRISPSLSHSSIHPMVILYCVNVVSSVSKLKVLV